MPDLPGSRVRPLALLNWLPADREAELRSQLEADGFRAIDLDGSGAVDAATFRSAAATQLFDGEETANWSSFNDQLRNHPVVCDADRVALVWTQVDRMLTSGLPDLVTALDILAGVARERYGLGSTFVVYLLGDGPNFAGQPA
jgi:hypothetical protein